MRKLNNRPVDEKRVQNAWATLFSCGAERRGGFVPYTTCPNNCARVTSRDTPRTVREHFSNIPPRGIVGFRTDGRLTHHQFHEIVSIVMMQFLPKICIPETTDLPINTIRPLLCNPVPLRQNTNKSFRFMRRAVLLSRPEMTDRLRKCGCPYPLAPVRI